MSRNHNIYEDLEYADVIMERKDMKKEELNKKLEKKQKYVTLFVSYFQLLEMHRRRLTIMT